MDQLVWFHFVSNNQRVKPILALFTSWCSHRHSDGHAMLCEMAALGFEYMELIYGAMLTLVNGILKAVEEGVVKISSTHNFCPLPTGVVQAAPNLFEPPAKDYREHDQWMWHTKRSLDFAAQMKARVLVCHLGSVQFFWFNPDRNLRDYLRDNPDAGRTPEDKTYHALLQNPCSGCASAWGRSGTGRRPVSPKSSTMRRRRA